MNKLLLVALFFLMNISLSIISSEIIPSPLDEARSRMVMAQSNFINRKITAKEFKNTVYDASKIIAREEERINNEDIPIKKQKNRSSDSYASSIKKAIMAWSGYEVTEEQKKVRQDFDILMRQRTTVEDAEGLVKLYEYREVEEKVLNKQYDEIIARINKDIYQQQAAIGNRWSLLKTAVIAIGVAAAATVAGLLFTNKIWLVENK